MLLPSGGGLSVHGRILLPRDRCPISLPNRQKSLATDPRSDGGRLLQQRCCGHSSPFMALKRIVSTACKVDRRRGACLARPCLTARETGRDRVPSRGVAY